MENKTQVEEPANTYKYVIDKYNHFSYAYNIFNGPSFLQMGQTFLNMVNLQNCNSILEAGCGSGHLAQEIAVWKKPNTFYLGIDLTPSMVRLTRHKLRNVFLQKRLFNLSELQKDIDHETYQKIMDLSEEE